MPPSESIQRGAIVRVRLDPVAGSEQGGDRPALVISPGIINDHSTMIIVAAITSRRTERVYPFEALIEPPDGGLQLRSKVMLRQLRSVERRRLTGRYGQLADETMNCVDEALKIAVGLTRL